MKEVGPASVTPRESRELSLNVVQAGPLGVAPGVPIEAAEQTWTLLPASCTNRNSSASIS